MTPILIPAGEVCYCGANDWTRGPGQGCTTVAYCSACGYVVAIIREAGQ